MESWGSRSGQRGFGRWHVRSGIPGRPSRGQARLPERGASQHQAEPPGAREAVQRIGRLLALAHKWERMIQHGEADGYAGIGRSTGLSRARVSQVCRLTVLAPCIQDAILNSGQPVRISVRQACAAAGTTCWQDQRDFYLRFTSVLP